MYRNEVGYFDLGQELGLLPVLEVIVVVACFRCNDQVSPSWIKEQLVDLAL